jgi:hypothetical protein
MIATNLAPVLIDESAVVLDAVRASLTVGDAGDQRDLPVQSTHDKPPRPYGDARRSLGE